MDENQDSNKPESDNSPKVELRSEDSGALEGAIDTQFVAKNKLAVIIGAIVVLLIVGLGVYAGLRSGGGDGDGEKNSIFGDLPLSDLADLRPSNVSGLSGVECEDADRRPIGVMLAGDPINRPVSGFAKADLVFELPVLVSDVTRLTAVYQCGRPGEIGSVRSARHDYLFLAEGVDAILGHWGGSYHALNRIAAGEFNTLNALTNPSGAFYRKSTLPAPYNGFTSYDGLWKALQDLGYREKTEFDGYEFKDDAPVGDRAGGGTLSIPWPGAFRVSYEYNPETNRYQRYWAGVKQVDGEDGADVAPSAIVVMRATNGPAEGPGGYNDVGIEGEGDMTVYQDGTAIPGRWRKNELYKNDPLHFTDENGDEITFTRGQVWIMAVEPNMNVTWEPEAATPLGADEAENLPASQAGGVGGVPETR